MMGLTDRAALHHGHVRGNPFTEPEAALWFGENVKPVLNVFSEHCTSSGNANFLSGRLR
jgi:hypothetical protein